MRKNISRVWMLVVVAGLALPVAAQVARSRTGTATINHVSAAKTPYTAEYHGTSVRTLADGTTITHEETEIQALDSQGRRMNSTTSTTPTGNHTPITHVFVFDPVAHTSTRWSSPGKQATVSTMSGNGEHGCSASTMESRPLGVTAPARGAHTRPRVENLGMASVQGVEARGTRTTTTIPAGAVGNEAPLVSTTERWTAIAVGLNGLMVRQTIDDPQSGKWTKELTSIEQSDPDPAVFQPPSGYEIVTETVTRGGSGGACPTEATVEATTSK